MRILVVSHEFPPIGGGGANACYYLTKGFCEQGHEVTVITANYRGLPKREITDGVEIIRVSSKRTHQEHCSFDEMLSFLIKAWPSAKKVVKQKHYDICQVFFGIPNGPIGYLLKRRYQIPYIIRFGGGDIPGAQARFDKIYKLIAPCIRLIWRNADRRVANSEGLRQRAYNFYDKKQVQVITNGVDTDYFMPQESTSDKINLLFVSRLIEGKGLQSLLPQMKKIIQDCNTEVHLTVVGDGPYRNTLEEIVGQEDIRQYVSFEGHKSKEQIAAYYQNADIFLLPSEQEGMPNVVLEAMSCGLPIVMTPCEGSAELIRDNGVIVPQERFAQEIIRICNNREVRIRMGNESRRMTVDQFSWDYAVNKYLELICEVVNMK